MQKPCNSGKRPKPQTAHTLNNSLLNEVASGAGVLLGVVAAKFVYAFFILGHTLPWMF